MEFGVPGFVNLLQESFIGRKKLLIGIKNDLELAPDEAIYFLIIMHQIMESITDAQIIMDVFLFVEYEGKLFVYLAHILR